MRINEIANAQEQLELLRLIIDNTWSAVKQQADMQARQPASKPVSKAKAQVKAARIPTPPKPKPLLKQPTQAAQQQLKQQQQQNQLVKQIQTAIAKPPSPNIIKPKHSTEMGSTTPKF